MYYWSSENRFKAGSVSAVCCQKIFILGTPTCTVLGGILHSNFSERVLPKYLGVPSGVPGVACIFHLVGTSDWRAHHAHLVHPSPALKISRPPQIFNVTDTFFTWPRSGLLSPPLERRCKKANTCAALQFNGVSCSLEDILDEYM